MKMKIWKKKGNPRVFTGSYERDRKGERIFVLTGGAQRVVFESCGAAKKLGWVAEDYDRKKVAK